MTTLEIWLLAVSLAIDCFTVSVTSGIILRRIQWRTFLKMAFFFGFFQALMPLIGWFGASRFRHLIEAYDHWIAFALLAFLGIRMIREHFKDSEECSFDPTSLKVILTMIQRCRTVVQSVAYYRFCIVCPFSSRQFDWHLLRETFQPAYGTFRRSGTDWHRRENPYRTSFSKSINYKDLYL